MIKVIKLLFWKEDWSWNGKRFGRGIAWSDFFALWGEKQLILPCGQAFLRPCYYDYGNLFFHLFSIVENNVFWLAETYAFLRDIPLSIIPRVISNSPKPGQSESHLLPPPFSLFSLTKRQQKSIRKLFQNLIPIVIVINNITSSRMSEVKIKNNEQQQENFIFDKVQPIELIYQKISVLATVKEQKEVDGKKIEVEGKKRILKQCSGRFSPNTFTAILGPSGCGKTTMLNLISGRQLSQNLELRGTLKINGEETNNIGKFKSYIGYVMQEDYMLPTFTPFQAFKFVADLRLSELSEEEKVKIVNLVIKNLGLEKCRDTYIGDTRIRGVSGGEKKRTSIGLELLINPSIIFLDEPTTGLDSTTSLNLIRFLNKLAKQGRTVISTIHQPSSEIFMQFHHIVLMVDGHIIYDGEASRSIKYFADINLPVPKHTNPTDYYMKLMNKEGIMLSYIEKKQDYTEEQIKVEFDERVNYLVDNFQKRKGEIIDNKVDVVHKLQTAEEISEAQATWWTQFSTIFKRNWINQFRQPLDVILKIFQSIFFGVICIILYYQKGTTIQEIIQNNQGVLFFLIMNCGFSYVFSSVNLFNFERPVFIRERLSNTYGTSAYFMGRLIAVQPVEILTVILFIAVAYFPCNLDNSAGVFFKSLLSMELCAYMSSGFGLLLSTIFSDAGVVMALVPVLIIPFLLVGGFFVPLETVFGIYYPFEYLSMFRFGFQAMVYSQYQNNPVVLNGVSYDVMASNYHFQIPFWLDLALMAIIGTAIRILALAVMYKISNPKIVPLLAPDNSGAKELQPIAQK